MDSKRVERMEDLTDALGRSEYLLLKHSTRCPVSSLVFREYESFIEGNPEAPTGWINVVESRKLSQWVTEETGVPHQSPQALLFRDGSVVWHASHWEIDRKALERAFRESSPDE